MVDPVPTILLVDDEPGMADSIAGMLQHIIPQQTPCRVVTATNVLQALDVADRVLAEHAPLLVVSDFNMGGSLDGLQLLDEIWQVKRDARLVLLSGQPSEDFEERPEFRRVHAFLPKPFDRESLGALASDFLAGTRA